MRAGAASQRSDLEKVQEADKENSSEKVDSYAEKIDALMINDVEPAVCFFSFARLT